MTLVRRFVAERAGEVVFVDATSIKIRYDRTDDELFVSFEDPITTYSLPKFRKTNQSTTIDLRPICFKGQRVEAGDVLTEGYSTQAGELALGRECPGRLYVLGRVTTMRMLSC